MSLREMVLRFKRYGTLLVLILVATFVIGLFPLARRINSYYSTSYVSLLKNSLSELLDQASDQTKAPFGAVVRRLNRQLVDIATNVDLSNLLRYEKLPWVSSDLRGIFVHGNSVKFLIEHGSDILLVEIPASLFERIISADMAYVFLTSSDRTIVVCNNLNLLGSKLNTEKGFLRLNDLAGFVHLERLEGFEAFVGSFIPLSTYLIVLLPYIIVALAALCGAVFWLNFAYSFENRLITAVNVVLDNVNQSLSKLEKTEEVVYVPIETKISELNQLQEGIHRLVEAQKASWHELHAMMQNLQDTVNDLEETQKTLQERNEQIIATLAEAIEVKDANTFGHSDRVVTLALELAKEVGLTDPADLEAIKFGALLHDIGKIGIPEHILNKPGRLTQQEYGIMKMHPIYGEKIIKKISGWDLVVDIVRHHHENYDGSGYPDGLKGGQISLRSQIVSLVDVFCALIEERPYRRALSVEEAVRLIEREMVGTKFDPRLYRAFVKVLERYLRAYPAGL
ncbi:HD-GYP domain-containing protein [Pseudothermotoga sp.]